MSTTGQAAIVLLELTHEVATVFPPLKAAAAGALYIAKTVQKFRSNRKAWAEFGQYIQDAVACVVRALPDASEPRTNVVEEMEKLRLILDEIGAEIDTLHHQSLFKRLRTFFRDPERISEMRKQFDDALALFNLSTMMSVGMIVEKAEDMRKRPEHGEKIVSEITQHSDLHTLPYMEGASWDPKMACLPDTRVTLLAEIDKWARAVDSTRICWVKGVAGSGKSAVAHTAAGTLKDAGILISSVFFDREILARRSPRKVFSTIARDLANLYPGIAEGIAIALKDTSLATASLSRQFEGLILEPSRHHKFDSSVVIVIDAMDEGIHDELDKVDEEFLTILRDEVIKLPNEFRILVTSRPTSNIESFLAGNHHTVSHSMDIYSADNKRDIATYIDSQLKNTAIRPDVSHDWPNDILLDEFKRVAGGLFIWVSTVCSYLRTAYDPDGKLKMLISKSSTQGLGPDKKMDRLYTTILNSCGDWEDSDFVRDYNIVMGALMAAKRPVSFTALEALHSGSQGLPMKHLLSRLGSVLTMGLAGTNQPVRILHKSFRDFITHRAGEVEETRKFHVSEQTHSRRLAGLCVRTMNRELAVHIPGTGYLASDRGGTPDIPEVSGISEQLFYSCELWTAHLADVESPVPSVMLNDISQVVSKHLIVWMEIITAKSKFQGSLAVWVWLQNQGPEIIALYDTQSQASTLFSLSARLSYAVRREEALAAIKEAVTLRRQLAAQEPATYNPDLATSLHELSKCLSLLGRQEERFLVIEEDVVLRRQLVAQQPATYNPDLATSLNELSNCLGHLGRHEEALTVIEEAMVLRRQLVVQQAATYNPDLATSLNELSNRLSHLGRREEALMVVEEAVALRRQLAAQRPATYDPDLATSLNELSECLVLLGRQEEALLVIEEAVSLRRQLAAQQPATYNSHLAISLNELSNCLGLLDRQKEALMVIEEAVVFRRQLAVQQPATYNSHLATSLDELSDCLARLGRQEEALSVIEEAVVLHRQLAAQRPATYNSGLTKSLNRLSRCLFHLGRREEALTVVEEAVVFSRQLAAQRPATYTPLLAISLGTLAIRLSALGRQEDALVATQEPVSLYQNLAAQRPAVFNEHLAIALRNLSIYLSDLSRHEEALAAVQEAVSLNRQLATQRPAAYNPQLARSLSNLSYVLSNLGRLEEAEVVSQEAQTLTTSS